MPVVHVSEETHRRVREYCLRKGRGMKEWADEVLMRAVEEGSSVKPVSKRRIVELERNEESVGPGPWELPPFWEGGGRDEEVEEVEAEVEEVQEGLPREREHFLEQLYRGFNQGDDSGQPGPDTGGAEADEGQQS